MTTEKAIQLLHRLQDEQFDGIHGDERREALEMAVRALSGEGDTISRKMAIDAIKSYWKNEVDRIPKKSTDFDVFTQICDSILSHNANICKVIDKLPSAQPQWISCSERLPSDEDYDETFTVTIQCEHYDGWDDYVTGYADWTPHGWDIQSYYMGQIKVTAWMPLPEPYGGESDVQR